MTTASRVRAGTRRRLPRFRPSSPPILVGVVIGGLLVLVSGANPVEAYCADPRRRARRATTCRTR